MLPLSGKEILPQRFLCLGLISGKTQMLFLQDFAMFAMFIVLEFGKMLKCLMNFSGNSLFCLVKTPKKEISDEDSCLPLQARLSFG
jgi:hypothetical protein